MAKRPYRRTVVTGGGAAVPGVPWSSMPISAAQAATASKTGRPPLAVRQQAKPRGYTNPKTQKPSGRPKEPIPTEGKGRKAAWKPFKLAPLYPTAEERAAGAPRMSHYEAVQNALRKRGAEEAARIGWPYPLKEPADYRNPRPKSKGVGFPTNPNRYVPLKNAPQGYTKPKKPSGKPGTSSSRVVAQGDTPVEGVPWSSATPTRGTTARRVRRSEAFSGYNPGGSYRDIFRG